MKPYKIIIAALMGCALMYSASAWSGKFKHPNQNKSAPKNVIVLIADGCGYNQVDAASYYQNGQAGTQVYEHFPTTLGMSTYMYRGSYDPAEAWDEFNYVNYGATDSAAAATAMSTGEKTYSGAIGVDVDGEPVDHIIEIFEDLRKSTGVVTSVQLSHATPAGFVAHNISRYKLARISQEMINASAVDVIMGCGHPWYDKNGNRREFPKTYKYVGNESTWNNLVAGVAGGDADGDGVDDPWMLVQTRAEFVALASGETPERVFGVAQVYKTLQQQRGGDGHALPYAVPPIESVPTLEEMTRAALNVLDNDKDGFFLMIEGGAVDWAAHDNQSGRVIEEQIDFNRSVEAVVEWVQESSSWGETLVIVTGDHETGYLNGPGSNPDRNPLVNNGASNLPEMEWHSQGHTNQLIPFYAKGRGAHLFKKKANELDPVHGPYLDNTEIAEVLFELFD